MAEWSPRRLDCSINKFISCHYANYPSGRQHESAPRVPRVSPSMPPPPPPQAQPFLPAPAPNMDLHFAPQLHFGSSAAPPAMGETPRENRNRAEKLRRDKLNKSVAELALTVPPVVAAKRKIDKTTVLRLTAHYLRAHEHVFGDAIRQSNHQHGSNNFSPAAIMMVLNMFNGFLITVTYRGIIVVVSQNVNQYLGYTELDLLGQNLLSFTHEDDRVLLGEQLMPRTQTLGINGELIIPDGPDGIRRVEKALASETRRFVIRLKKLGQRSVPPQYLTCHVEGSLRKSDRACRGYNRCCPIVRRARARSENPCSSGNDIVFIGIVRPTSESFLRESTLDSYCMEYRTRHSIDGEIIQCDPRIAMVTGYMVHEVRGVNAMNFIHRDDVRWVIIALREMYDQHRLFGESCYRLITKNEQVIYMRTRGCLDVEPNSRAVTSFMCTNTMVDEKEGKQLIKQMKRKFTLLVNNNQAPPIEEFENDEEEENEDQSAPVEDPRRLEEVILHLVTNLPSPSSQENEEEQSTAANSERNRISPHRLTIIPPNKERIVNAIEKSYSVINIAPKDTKQEKNHEQSKSAAESSHTTPQYIPHVDMNIPSMPDNMSSLPDNMSSLSVNMSSLPDNMSSLPGNMSSLSANMSSLPDNMSSLPDNMSSLPVNMSSLPDNMSSLPGYMSSLSANMSSLPNNMSSLPDNMSSLSANMSSLPDNMSSLPNNMSSLPDNMNSLPDYMSQLPDHINGFPNLLNSLTDQTNSFPDLLNSFSEHVNHFPDLMNGFPAPQTQQSQIVPYQNINVPNQPADDSSLIEQLADIENFNFTGIDFNTDDLLNDVASPEMENSENYADLSSLFENLQNGEKIFSEQQIAQLQEFEYHGAESETTMPMPQYAVESNQFQALSQATTSSYYSCGTKRPSDSDDYDTACKRKITQIEFVRAGEFLPDLQEFQEVQFVPTPQFNATENLTPEPQFIPAEDWVPEAACFNETDYFHEAEFIREANFFREPQTVAVHEIEPSELPEELETPLDISSDESREIFEENIRSRENSITNRTGAIRESAVQRREVPAGRTIE